MIMQEWSETSQRWFDNWKTWNEIIVPSFPTEKLHKFRKKFGLGFVEYDAMCLEITRRLIELTDLAPRSKEPSLIERLESIVDFFESVLPSLIPLQLEVWRLMLVERIGLFSTNPIASSSKVAKRVNVALTLASERQPGSQQGFYICWTDHGCWLSKQGLLIKEISKTFLKETEEETPDLELNARVQNATDRFSRLTSSFHQRRKDLESSLAAGSSVPSSSS